MVERWDPTEPLPPARPVSGGRPPLADGERVPGEPAELPPPTSLAERLPVLLSMLVVVLAVIVGVLTR